MKKYYDFLNITDQYFSVRGEQVIGKGEDSYLIYLNECGGIIGVFDGCGGSGARKYPAFDGHTGAYVASRILAEETYYWFKAEQSRMGLDIKNEKKVLKENIDRRLKACTRKDKTESLLMGSMHKEFPSTLATAVVRYKEGKAGVSVLWSGDSRVFFLDKNGLHQATIDDLPNPDAMLNLREDAGMVNVVSASHSYEIHEETYLLEVPCVIFAATDGCFGYLKTPMEFEKLLLGCLHEAKSIAHWQELLDERFKQIAGDDYTLCMLILGFGSFQKLKDYFLQREIYMKKTYPLSGLTPESELFSQWEKYKAGYEYN